MTTSPFVRLIGLMVDSELARALARGDRRMAAALLVRSYAPDVFALCRAMVRDTPLAEDLSHDAFARAFAALDGFRGEASPRTWLLKIARNRCLDHLGHAKRAPWARDPDPEPDDHAVEQPTAADVLANRDDAELAMAALGETERALVVLHFGHGVGYPELADSFGLAQGAVRMRVSRALAKMRDALRDAADHVVTGEYAVVERASADADSDDLEADASLSFGDDFDEAEASMSLGRSNTESMVPNQPYDIPSHALWHRLQLLVGATVSG